MTATVTKISAASTTTKIAQCVKSPKTSFYQASVYVGGTFGGTTASLLASPDGGATTFAVLNQSGSAITFTSAGMVEVQLAGGYLDVVGNAVAGEQLYLSLSGGSGIALVVTVVDNISY